MARKSKAQAPVVAIEDTEVQETGTVVEQAEQVVAEAEGSVQIDTNGETVSDTTETVEDTSVHCALCGRLLTAGTSVERGIGPLCVTHIKRILGIGTEGKPATLAEVSDEALAEAITTAKTAQQRIDVADFNADENVHPAFPDRGAMKFVTLASVDKALRAEGRSITKFVQAFGGDRGLLEPKEWYWTPVYVGRMRYLAEEVMSHLDDIDLVRPRAAKAPVAPTGDAPVAEGEAQVPEANAEDAEDAEVQPAPADEAETPAEVEETGEES